MNACTVNVLYLMKHKQIYNKYEQIKKVMFSYFYLNIFRNNCFRLLFVI